MDWQNDPELEMLFKEELDERSRSLAEGANAMLAGEITSELTGRMIREGHTIKGTGRVMGYEGIARGGETCESIWRLIQLGDLSPTAMLARTLLLLAESMPESVGGDVSIVSEAIETVRTLVHEPGLLEKLPEPLVTPEPVEPEVIEAVVVQPESEPEPEPELFGTPEVIEAVVVQPEPESEPEPEPEPGAFAPLVFEPGPDGKLVTPQVTYEIVEDVATSEPSIPDVSLIGASSVESTGHDQLDVPPNLVLVGTERSVLDPDGSEGYDLGGLVGLAETWATEESVHVNAGRLFRMINDSAALRIDLESVAREALLALSGEKRGVPTAGAQSVLESLEAVRRSSARLESAALGLTVVPISAITATLPQLVKYLSKNVDREVGLVIEGEGTLIDRQLIDRVGEVIRQIVVNAVTHGIESRENRVAAGKDSLGTIRVSVSRDDSHIQLVISDDGGGIDWIAVRSAAIEAGLIEGDPTADELRSILFVRGFSTNPEFAKYTGREEGLDRVAEIVEEVFGSMTLDTVQGSGTSFVIRMPAHRALQRAQMFTAGERTWGIPDTSVAGILPIQDVSISVTEKGSSIGFEHETVPYASFASVVGLDVEGIPSHTMVIRSPTGLVALAVDEILDIHEVAMKDLGPLLSGTSVVSGVALLGGDDTVMLVDAGRLAENMRSVGEQTTGPVHKILVVDDSQGVRQVVSGLLASHGFSTVSADGVSEALALLAENGVDALVVDFSMPRADGVALIHMVRQRYGEIPVVMLSGVASAEDRSRAERAGVDAFFDKADFAKGGLVQKLKELINTETNGENDLGTQDSVIAS